MQDIYEDHTRWSEEHRRNCEDCYADWVDACSDMADDARLDAMAEMEMA